MEDTKKMLRTIINGLSAIKSELLREIKKVDAKVNNLDGKVEGLRAEMKQGFEKLTVRVDKIGLQVARLEDDTPTRDEFDDVHSRLKKLEQN